MAWKNQRLLGWLVVVLAFLNLQSGWAREPLPEPPKAPQKEHITTLHGKTLVDPFFWLRERENPEVLRYLKDENTYLEKSLDAKVRRELFDEMAGRIPREDTTVPVPQGEYSYYSRTVKDQQYDLYCRKKKQAGAPEEIILDGNALAKGKDFFAVGDFRVSPDQKFLAYSVDFSGGESYEVHVKNLETGKLLADHLDGTYYGLEWGNDNTSIFYITSNETLRPYRVYRHVLGTATATDELLFEENDNTFAVTLSKTRSQKWLVISTSSKTSTEILVLDADSPKQPFLLLAPRRPGIELVLEHHGESLLLLTNEQAKNFRVVAAPVAELIGVTARRASETWKDLVAHDPEVKIEEIEPFENFLVLHERKDGLQRLRRYDFRSREFSTIGFAEPVFRFWIESSENPEYESTVLRINYDSLLTPHSVFDVDLETGGKTLLKQEEIIGGYHAPSYISERLWVTASDGVKIPLSLVYRKDVVKNGRNPLYLTGYGAYGSTYDPDFTSNRLSLLDRGFVFAIAHVRGGGELGKPWYEDGRVLKKKNSILDLISCAEFLIREKYTASDRLVISGMSTGGLLVSAATVMRPDLFAAAVAEVPFVDAINTMLDQSIPLVSEEFEEWGDPRLKDHFEYLYSYSPYDNIRPVGYPNMLITAGLNDSRVQYWEPAKFAAKLRALKTDQNLLLLKTNMEAGHMGASGRLDYLKEIAIEDAFLFKVLNIKF